MKTIADYQLHGDILEDQEPYIKSRLIKMFTLRQMMTHSFGAFGG